MDSCPQNAGLSKARDRLDEFRAIARMGVRLIGPLCDESGECVAIARRTENGVQPVNRGSTAPRSPYQPVMTGPWGSIRVATAANIGREDGDATEALHPATARCHRVAPAALSVAERDELTVTCSHRAATSSPDQ